MEVDDDDNFMTAAALFDTAAAEAAFLLFLADEEPSAQPRGGLRKNCFGDTERRGGYRPHKRQQTELHGREGWRHRWRESPLWRLVQQEDTYDESTWHGNRFRSLLGVPRVIFDELETEAGLWSGTRV